MAKMTNWGIPAVCAALCVYWVATILFWRWWTPYSRRRFYEKQGIRGPAFRPFIGNLPEIHELLSSIPRSLQFTDPTSTRTIPYLVTFARQYGNVSIHEVGSSTRLEVTDPMLVKQVLLSKASCYSKSVLHKEALAPLVGKGLVASDGSLWKEQHRIISPSFRPNHLKADAVRLDQSDVTSWMDHPKYTQDRVFHHILDCGEELVQKWQTQISNTSDGKCAEITIDLDIFRTTVDIVGRATFGSNRVRAGEIDQVSKGAMAAEAMKALVSTNSDRLLGYGRLLPGFRFLPIASHRKLWRHEKVVDAILEEIVDARLAQATKGIQQTKLPHESIYGHDLLGIMMESMQAGSATMTKTQLLHECKTIFAAGNLTTAALLTWTLTMLSAHPEWQHRARSEVEEVLGDAPPDAENIANLKSVSMILNETLRLYPSVTYIERDSIEAHELGDISVLPGTTIVIPIAVIHQSQELWGKDATSFKPDRWESVAHPDAFLPFGGGTRICLGKSFALMEAKALVCMLLQRFSFSLSPGYRHAPGIQQAIIPAHGVQLLVSKLHHTSST